MCRSRRGGCRESYAVEVRGSEVARL
jgi:hypothetical protein